MKLKSGISVDPVFRELVHAALETQRLEINKVINKQTSNIYNIFT